jgi:hypothetical protein
VTQWHARAVWALALFVSDALFLALQPFFPVAGHFPSAL